MPTRTALLAAVVLAAACAHAADGRRAGAAAAAPPPERVLVTGSRIPRRVDPATGRASSIAPVRVYTREEIARTGRPGDLGGALRRLDPALGP